MDHPTPFRQICYILCKWCGLAEESVLSVCGRSRSIFILLFIVAFSLVARGRGLKDLSVRLDNIILKSGIPKKSLGISVGSNLGGKSQSIFQLNDTKKMIPASLTKIVTGLASLERLTVSFKSPTKLATIGKEQGGVLDGDLYFIGGGDSGYVSENMWFLVNEFIRSGVRVVKGDVIVDDSRFDLERFDSGRDPERVDRAYDAPIGALSFNWNSVNIFVQPGAKKGSKAEVYADPMSNYIMVSNRATTSRGARRSIHVSRVNGRGGDTIKVSGNIGHSVKEIVKYSSISKPEFWSGEQLIAFLRQRGIEVSGTVRRGKSPSGMRVLAEYEGKAVGDSVADMLKFSNNFVAEMLTKNIAAELVSEPGTMKKGIDEISRYLQTKGLSQANFHISSPSGLSRLNRFRAVDIMSILLSVKNEFMIFPEFVSALPIAGVDGTLKNRMKNSIAVGRVRAKTGLLSGVVGLAGYVGRKSGENLAFSMMYNGKRGMENQVKRLFDRLAIEMVR